MSIAKIITLKIPKMDFNSGPLLIERIKSQD